MQHNELRLTVLSNILRLQRFTVPELCSAAGLRRNQVYPLLSSLAEEKFLSVRPVAPPGEVEKRAAHRPLNIYELTQDVDKRRELLDQVSPFLRLLDRDAEAGQSVAFARGQTELAAVGVELTKLGSAPRHLWYNQLVLDGLRQRLDAVREDFEIASYDIDQSTDAQGREQPLDTALTQLNASVRQIEELEERTAAVAAQMRAQREYASALRDVAQMKRPTLRGVRQHLAAAYQDASAPFRGILSAVLEALHLARSFGKFAGARMSESQFVNLILAESAARYSSDAALSLRLAETVAQSARGQHWLRYNVANLCMLAGEDARGFATWRGWAKTGARRMSAAWPTSWLSRGGRAYQGIVIVKVSLDDLTQNALQDLEQAIGVVGAYSVVAQTPVDILGVEPYVAKPTLFDPLRRADCIRVSDALQILQPELYVYGPLEDFMKLPGVPSLRLATMLAWLGVAPDDAWKVSQALKSGEGLLVIHSASGWSPQVTRALKAFLERRLSGTHLEAAGARAQRLSPRPSAYARRPARPASSSAR